MDPTGVFKIKAFFNVHPGLGEYYDEFMKMYPREKIMTIDDATSDYTENWMAYQDDVSFLPVVLSSLTWR